MRAHKEILALHAFADAGLAAIKRQTAADGRPVVCAMGCSACCYEPVYAERREAEHALGRVTPQARARVKERTREWLAKVVPSGLLNDSLPNVFKWRALRAACPFLENNRCSVYQDRPCGCRLHCATGPKENCFDDALRPGQTYAYSPEVLARLSHYAAKVLGRFDQDNLGVWLAEILLRETVPSGSREEIDNRNLAHLCREDPQGVAATLRARCILEGNHPSTSVT